MTKHAYMPRTIISDKVSALVFQVIKEVADVLGITLEDAPTKHAQTIEKLEPNQASHEKALKNEMREKRSTWHKYVII